MEASRLQIAELDGPALRKLAAEPNSSKYAIDAHNRGIKKIGDLSELPKLCSLDVSFNHILVIENLGSSKELREFKAYNNKLTTTKGLRGNSNLEGLMLNENQISEISEDLLALAKLKTLSLSGNCITSVRNLTASRLLVHLDLSRNDLAGTAAEGLENLSSLESLNLSNNRITSLGNLAHLTKLEELNLAENQLASFDGTLPQNLNVLRLNGNRLPALKKFSWNLAKLNELYLHDNEIAEVGNLAARCPNLESLDLRNNRVHDVADIAALGAVSLLQDLWLAGNPCCASSTYLLDVIVAIPELKTLDNLTDSQLKENITALQNGTVSQDTLLARPSPRPMTPSTRPGTSSGMRPCSSGGGNRPVTPSSSGRRPATPDRGAPIFHRPSSRAGTVVKLASPDELEHVRAEVAERLQKMKVMLKRIGTDTNADPERSSRATNPSIVQASTRVSDTRIVLKHSNQDRQSQSRAMRSSGDDAPPVPKRTKTKAITTDAGTDPLDSLMGSNRSSSHPPLSVSTPRDSRGTETEEQPLLPPAPMAVPASTSTLSPPLPLIEANQDEGSQASMNNSDMEQQLDGEAIEKEMKQLLVAFTKEPHPEDIDENNNSNGTRPSFDEPEDKVIESPRIVSSKMAEQRQPPTHPRSRQGYRSFRLPTRTQAMANSTAANAV